jgi:DNA repair exonuclease SbcCD nuclease subunit
MKISVISDSHLGHDLGRETGNDSFEMFKQVLSRSMDSDLILMTGDLFDSRSPGSEIFARAMEILIEPILKKNSTQIVKGIGKNLNELSPIHNAGIPIVAIHGTHERRVKGLINPVQVLEKAGFLIHLHCNSIVIEKGQEKVCIHGMSGVPDQYSESVLSRWNPKPLENCFNILMLHQSIKPFMYAKHLMNIEKLPPSFNLYICGHIHESVKSSYSGSPLIVPGSLITTQITKESVRPKGFWQLETKNPKESLMFMELENQRRVFYREIDDEPTRERIEGIANSILSKGFSKKPIIRIKIHPKNNELDLNAISGRFSDRAILSFSKTYSDQESPGTAGIEEHSLSVEELGREFLKKNAESSGIEPGIFETIFEQLQEGKMDEALGFLKNKLKDKPIKESGGNARENLQGDHQESGRSSKA